MATLNTGRMAPGQSFSSAIPSGMRCVTCIGDDALAARVLTGLTECAGIVVVGRATDWPCCEALIEEYCPELLVISGDLSYAVGKPSGTWPIVLKVTTGGGDRHDDLTIPETVAPDALLYALWRVQRKIIEQKGLELQQLLSNYLEATAKRYRESFEVLDRHTIRLLKAEDVTFISVDGNYAVLNTTAGVFKVRETLNNLMDSLDPERFARIHRSAIVNLSVVSRFVEDPEGSALLLHDGTRLSVGPTFEGRENLPLFKIGH